jgi:hypothetical protein
LNLTCFFLCVYLLKNKNWVEPFLPLWQFHQAALSIQPVMAISATPDDEKYFHDTPKFFLRGSVILVEMKQ